MDNVIDSNSRRLLGEIIEITLEGEEVLKIDSKIVTMEFAIRDTSEKDVLHQLEVIKRQNQRFDKLYVTKRKIKQSTVKGVTTYFGNFSVTRYRNGKYYHYYPVIGFQQV